MTDRELARKLHAAWAAENPYDWRAQWHAVAKTARALITAELAAKAVPGEDEVSNTIKEIDSWNDILKSYELPPDYLIAVERLKQEVNKSFATLQAQIATACDDALREAALMAGSLAETTYDTMPGFKVCLDIEARIRSLITTPAPENGNGPVP